MKGKTSHRLVVVKRKERLRENNCFLNELREKPVLPVASCAHVSNATGVGLQREKVGAEDPGDFMGREKHFILALVWSKGQSDC